MLEDDRRLPRGGSEAVGRGRSECIPACKSGWPVGDGDHGPDPGRGSADRAKGLIGRTSEADAEVRWPRPPAGAVVPGRFARTGLYEGANLCGRGSGIALVCRSELLTLCKVQKSYQQLSLKSLISSVFIVAP
jgi:hypothetical protein